MASEFVVDIAFVDRVEIAVAGASDIEEFEKF